MSLLLKNGRVVDPATGLDETRDIWIEKGRVKGLSSHIDQDAKETIDCTGLMVLPGLVDPHVHLREPGQENKETIATGARAAAAGGFVAVACMPNTHPVNDGPEVTRFLVERGQEAGHCQIHPVGAISSGLQGKEITPMGQMMEQGAVAFSDDGRPVMDSHLMRRAMEYAKDLGASIIDHCEDLTLAPGWAMHEGSVSAELGLKGLPVSGESIQVWRDVELARLTGASVHIAHISTTEALEAVQLGRAKGIPITCEVTPHHLFLDHSEVKSFDPATKMSPPLRRPEDCEALVKALICGEIQMVATDHAPHTWEEKSVEYTHCPFGVVGLEIVLSLMVDRLVLPGHLSWLRLAEVMSLAPARFLGLNSLGRIEEEGEANLTLVNPRQTWTVNPEEFYSKGRFTPFSGQSLQGRPVATLLKGIFTHRDREFL